MIREIKWPVWLVIITLSVFLVAIVGNGIKLINSATSHEQAVTVEINSEQIDSGIRLQTETKEADSFTSFVTFPFTEVEELDVPMNNWVEEQEQLFHNEIIISSDILSEEIKAHFNLQSKITKIAEHVFSVEMEVEHFVDKETVYVSVKTFNLDLNKKEFIQLTDVINKNALEEGIIHTLLNDKIQKIDQSLTDSVHNLEIEQLTWLLHNEHLSFYFNANELGEHQEIIRVDISHIDLHEYFTEDYSNRLITGEILEEIEQIKKEATQTPRTLDTDGKYIALTFDDGPHKSVTPRILATLKEYNAKATFFMLSKNVEYNPDLALQVAYEGHEIANHTNTHVNLNAVNANRIHNEVKDSQERIENAIGIKPVTFRPPYGEYNSTVLTSATESDQSVIMWSIDTLDWKSRNANSIYNIAVTQARPGSIILFHDIHEPTADALPKILQYLSEEGYEFVTVSELLPIIEARETGLYFGN